MADHSAVKRLAIDETSRANPNALKDRRAVRGARRQELDALLVKMTTKRTARAWH